jgi:Cu/Ag efflux protein CusF
MSKMKGTTMFAIAAGAMVATHVFAQPPVTKTTSVTTTATIQAIDSTARTVTLRDDKGQEDKYAVGPEVKRFDELKVGDKVKMTYYESIVYQLRKPGDKSPVADAADAAITRGKGALPSATAAVQEKMTVTVKAIDPAVPSVTVTTADGRTVTRKIENKKNIEGLKVGDQVDITYTLAVLANIERAK